MMERKTTVAVFDLDGTLSRGDTYLPYLLGFLLRHPWRVFRLAGLPWVVLKYILGRIDNTEVKRRFLDAFMGNTPLEVVSAWSETFVEKLLRNGFRREGLEVVARHQAAGDVVVLMSASLDIYVLRIGEQLKFDHVICTEVRRVGGRINGDLAGPNCYGPEKALRFAELRKKYPNADFVVYADHHSDIPLLLMADRGVMVNAARKTARIAQRHGITECQWDR